MKSTISVNQFTYAAIGGTEAILGGGKQKRCKSRRNESKSRSRSKSRSKSKRTSRSKSKSKSRSAGKCLSTGTTYSSYTYAGGTPVSYYFD